MTDNNQKNLKQMICKYLHEVYGGDWEYDNIDTTHTRWNCNDGIRKVTVNKSTVTGIKHIYSLYVNNKPIVAVTFDKKQDMLEVDGLPTDYRAVVRAIENLPNTDEEVPTKREKLLAEALYSTLIACGVLNGEVTPSGPELICAAEMFCENKK